MTYEHCVFVSHALIEGGHMTDNKKPYEKPKVKAIKMLEVGAALCCRATLVTCSAPTRNSRGKGQRTSTSS